MIAWLAKVWQRLVCPHTLEVGDVFQGWAQCVTCGRSRRI